MCLADQRRLGRPAVRTCLLLFQLMMQKVVWLGAATLVVVEVDVTCVIGDFVIYPSHSIDVHYQARPGHESSPQFSYYHSCKASIEKVSYILIYSFFFFVKKKKGVQAKIYWTSLYYDTVGRFLSI